MDQYILEDIKRSLGPAIECDDSFDNQILGLIDIALLQLAQVGCLQQLLKPIDADSKWSSIVNPPKDLNVLPAIKQYVYLHVKILFDPPVSNVVQVMEELKAELHWRIKEAYE